ncbi:MAG: hypothetical protein R2771_13680 [Saprospiraceae bacterium]
MKGFAIEELEGAQIAVEISIIHYLKSTENNNLRHINSIQRIYDNNFVWLDRFTIRNLELINPQHASGFSLIKVLDKTTSPMGSRLLKKWVLSPLVSPYLSITD